MLMIKRTLSEQGEISAMRVMSMAIVFVLVGVWGYVSVIKKEIQPIDIEQVLMIATALGFKTWQKNREVDNGPGGAV